MTVSALYLHIPFCISRCSYCDFVSSEYSRSRASDYLEALDMLCDRYAQSMRPRTIYIGGGTPTCLELDQLQRLGEIIRRIDRSSLREFSIEANPGTVNVEKTLCLKEMGVTRVSLGVQSFSRRGLEVLGRIHNERQVRTALACLREAGLDNLSADLIFGWPGEDIGVWRADLLAALSLKVKHLSVYGLTYEEDAPITERVQAGILDPVSEDVDRSMFDLAGEVLGAAGFARYEISNFALPGSECLHNIAYWEGDEYFGLGAGAYSFADGCRFGMEDDVDRFIEVVMNGEDPVVERETLPPEQHARECGVIWLRMTQGIDLESFRTRTGFDAVELWGKELRTLLDDGWLAYSEDGRRLRLTPNALPLADTILAELV